MMIVFIDRPELQRGELVWFNQQLLLHIPTDADDENMRFFYLWQLHAPIFFERKWTRENSLHFASTTAAAGRREIKRAPIDGLQIIGVNADSCAIFVCLYVNRPGGEPFVVASMLAISMG